MITHWRTIRRALAYVTLAVALAQLSSAPVLAQSSGCNTNDSGAPCLTDNPDILGGEQAHNLLRTDDLALLRMFPAQREPPNIADIWLFRLNTTNSILAPSKVIETPGRGGTEISAVAVGRMFNVDRDTIVTALNPFGDYFMTIDEKRKGREMALRDPFTDMVMADFTGDGFADLFSAFSDGSMGVVTALDVNTPFGLRYGLTSVLDPVYRMTVGDFNGDGRPEVAGLINNNGAYFLGIYTVDPKTLRITRAAGRRLNGEPLRVAAGRFGTLNYDQLVTLGRLPNGECCVVQAYDFEKGSLQPIPQGSVTVPAAAAPSVGSRIFSGPFIPGAYQQVLSTAVVKQGSANRVSVGLLTFSRDGKLIPTLVGGISTLPLNVACAHDMAVGNFNRQIKIDDKQQYDPRLNFAVAGTDCFQATMVQVFTVDSTVDPKEGAKVTYTSPQTVRDNFGPNFRDTVYRLAAGDLQGRSFPLGPPEKLTIASHIQPDTILGMPPMHVDWIAPNPDSPPSILNVSVFPDTFNTGYNFTNTTGAQASHQSTTSYTSAIKQFTELKKSWGIPKVSETSVTLKTAFQRKHEHTVAKTYNTNKGQAYELTAKTVFDDLVAATENRLNIYTYPALGQCIDKPGAPPLDHCPAGKAPLHIQFSSPDNVYYLNLVTGGALEWYQPVHEPGQLFSYPGNLAQLKADQPQQPTENDETESNVDLLSDPNVIWESQANQQVAIRWTQDVSRDLSSSTVNTNSFDSSLTFAGKSEASGLEGTAGFEYNSSRATSTLNQSLNTYSESAGVRLNRGSGNGNPNYRYQGQAFIFGQKAPLGTIQTDIPQNTDVKAQGFLSVGYAANPVSTGRFQSGLFWKQAYNKAPDVALNHPLRWLQDGQHVQFNCPIGFTSSFGQPCTTTGQPPTPANVAFAPFYRMKGLFVTPGTTTEGPTTNQARQGDTVTLRARVYNYSLKNMPGGTKVRVQFYAQPWSTSGQFLSQPGNPAAFAPAVFIGEDTLGLIPAFCGGLPAEGQEDVDPCSDDKAPRNWVFAQTRWDTSTVAANTNWKFWVVVWMERDGQKVDEIEDHGLTFSPGSLPLNSLAEVPIETYSNNLGFYNQVFRVGPRAGARQAPARSRQLKSQWETLPKGGALRADQLLTVGASHRAVGGDLDNVMVLFYDGDPEQDGQLFDMELIPHIEANESFVTHVPYHTEVCGIHELFVRAIPTDGAAPMTTDVSTVTVACPAPSVALTKFQGKAEHVGSGTNNGKLQVSGTVVGVGGLELSATTLRLLDLLRESAGAGELVRDSFGPLLPLQLTARPGSNGKSAIFETPSSTITPQVRVELKQANPNKDELDFSARIERVVMKAPQACGASAKGTVQLQTRFSLTSPAREPVDITTEQPWQCKGDQLKTP